MAHTLTPQTFKGWSSEAIYLTDNGAAYCGDHLGMTAMMTGRDTSGQKVYRVTKADADYWQKMNMAHNLPMCEQCKKTWTR